ncbi:MAG TPA: ABC transporter substrate-binding protein [Methylomirabilota bacterium]|jgi:putative ABC transport system substrate-binding protein|nr:ABC transporter substrate-binding protein [Methylomirabilota bacterium]
MASQSSPGCTVSRRAVVGLTLALPVLVTGIRASAQTALRRIGILAQDLQPGLLETLRDELARLGHVEGRTLSIEVRNAAGRAERLPGLVAELLQLKVEVIVAVNTPAAQAARKATTMTPIVIMRVADPIGQGLVKSLTRPEGNVTGVSFMPDELGAKGVQILHEVMPNLTQIAALYQGDNPGARLVVTETERRARLLGLRFLHLPIRDPAELPGVFQTAVRAHVEGLFVMDDGAMTKLRRQITEQAARHNLPVVSIYRDLVEAGGLIAYGPSLTAVYRRGAGYVDRILRGARPTDLPVELPTQFDLAINLKTAKALGLTIPPSVLLRADHVIE